MRNLADRTRDGNGELERFHRLVNVSVLATFVLIVIGGVVRVSDSGLGCGPAGSGTDGWPLCGGGILPGVDGNALIEFTHRAAAGVVAILIAVIAWRALRRLRDHRWLVRGSLAAAVLVLIQAGLGGLTVEHNLEDELVAAHLGLAMVLLGILIALSRAAVGERREPAPGGPGVRALAVLTSALLLATIVAGGYMAGTEREGAEVAPGTYGAHFACGQQFPTCLDQAMPFGTSRLVDIHLAHRGFMYLAAISLIALVVVARHRGIRSRGLLLALGLLALQIVLGALNVWLGEHAGLIVAHLTVGTLLWATVVYAALELVPSAARRSEPTRREPEGAAAPA